MLYITSFKNSINGIRACCQNEQQALLVINKSSFRRVRSLYPGVRTGDSILIRGLSNRYFLK